MTSTNTEPTLNQPCTCAEVIGDSDVDRLHRLMGAGMDQRSASALLWSQGAAFSRSIRDGMPSDESADPRPLAVARAYLGRDA